MAESDTRPTCTLCGEPMPAGEEMFKYHGYSGPCPKPPLREAPIPLEQSDARFIDKLGFAAFCADAASTGITLTVVELGEIWGRSHPETRSKWRRIADAVLTASRATSPERATKSEEG